MGCTASKSNNLGIVTTTTKSNNDLVGIASATTGENTNNTNYNDSNDNNDNSNNANAHTDKHLSLVSEVSAKAGSEVPSDIATINSDPVMTTEEITNMLASLDESGEEYQANNLDENAISQHNSLSITDGKDDLASEVINAAKSLSGDDEKAVDTVGSITVPAIVTSDGDADMEETDPDYLVDSTAIEETPRQSLGERIKSMNDRHSISSRRSSVRSPSSKLDYDYMFKIILLGDSGVGKTSIMKRCCLDDFKDWYTPTKGTDFKFKAIQYKRHSDSMQDINNSHDQSFSDQKNKEDRIKLQIWDTAGQERHINANPDFYQKGLGFILVFSIDDLHSFQNIKSWHQLAVSKGYKSPLVKMCLLGHKSDLASERQVSKETAEELAQEMQLPYYEASSKDSINLEEILNNITSSIMKEVTANPELLEEHKGRYQY